MSDLPASRVRAPSIALDGTWRVVRADDDVRRTGIGLDVDDADWTEIEVPGHWRHHPAFADNDDPLLYRRRFSLPAPGEGCRRWVTLDGVFYQADVFLDGAYLGDPEGYFLPHTYDVTALSKIGDEHVLAVEVACAPHTSHRGRRNITGLFQHWDGIDRDWNPGGIWRTVSVYDTGPVRIDRLRLLCRDANDVRAHLLCNVKLDSDAPRQVVVRTAVDGVVVAEHERRLARGFNEVKWGIDIADPELWWPRSLGDQPLTTVSVEVDVDRAVSDRRARRTGLRHVAWNNWTCSVNGEPVFLKGANLLPTRAALAEATVDEMRRDVELAVETGLDALRVHAHIAPSAIYDAADELGVLLLQDFPLQWGYARSVRGQAVRQAEAAVDRLGHHPSIVQWNAHNDPVAAGIGLEGDTPRTRLRYLAGQQLPTWNKSVLDRWVRRSIERADPTRLVVPHSGVLPHFPRIDGTDSHFYFGWYHGDVEDIARLARTVPRLVRFVSEFGAQSVPDDAGFLDPERWPDLDWDRLERAHGLQKWVFDRRVPPAGFATFESWQHATQTYQAELLRHHIEVLRRLKYRPAGGFCLFALNDPAPMVSWSILDHNRNPKAAWTAVRAACRPVIVVADRPPSIVAAGDELRLDVHVVNDRREPVTDAIAEVVASWPGGEQTWRFAGDVEADDVALVGTIELTVPDTLGALTFGLRLSMDDATVGNRYRSAITARN